MNNKFAAEVLLNHALYEYQELSNTWRDLERKAQGTIAGSGIFLAGNGVGISSLDAQVWLTIIMFIVSIALLALSAIYSIWVLQVAEIYTIEDTSHVLRDAESIFTSDKTDNIDTFIINRVEKWQHASIALHDENNKKSTKLSIAHKYLVAAIVSTMITMFIIVCMKT